MANNNQFQQVSYGLSQPLVGQNPPIIKTDHDPGTQDKYPIGTLWINLDSNSYFICTSIVDNQATWIASTSSTPAGLLADTGTASFSGGYVTIAGGSNLNTSATGSTLTVNLDNSPSVSGSITAGTGITTNAGSISAPAGTVTGGTGLIASSGGITTTGTNTFNSLGAGVMQTNSSGVISSTNGSNGQVLLGGGAAPAWASFTAGANISLTPGPNSLTIAAAGGAGGTVSQLSGNASFATPDGGGNINIVGSGNVTVTGDGVNTLTATITGTTDHAVQVGNAGGSLSSLSVGTNGQVLLGSTGANPSFVTPTAGSGLSVTANASTLEWAISAPVSVSNGGTGATTLGLNGALYGNTTSAVGVTAAGTNGQILIGSTGNPPAFASITSSGGTITPTGGANTLNLDVTAATTTQSGAVTLATNAETIAGSNTTKATTPDDIKAKLGSQTSHGVPYGAGTSSALSWTSAGSNGQVLIGATGAAPAFSSLTSTGGTLTITTGPNSINLDVVAGSANKVNGDSGFATFTGGEITLSGGTSGAVYTGAAATLTTSFNYLSLPATTSTNGQIDINSTRWLHAYGTHNTFVGGGAGNTTLTTGSAINNVGIGFDSTRSLTTGQGNVGLGVDSLYDTTTGSYCVGLGYYALNNVTTGSYLVGLGYFAGDVYTTESSNICIGNAGTVLDANTIRIGTSGSGSNQHNKTYIAGVTTLPDQPAFMAYRSSNTTNVTGAGTSYTVIYNSEQYDISSSYNTGTGYFTAPNNGVYNFATCLNMSGISSAMTGARLDLVIAGSGVSVGTYPLITCNPYDLRNVSTGAVTLSGSLSVYMNASDTACIVITVSGGAGNTADVLGSSPLYVTTFSGYKCA